MAGASALISRWEVWLRQNGVLLYLRATEAGILFDEPRHLKYKRSVAALGALTVLASFTETRHHLLTNVELQKLALHSLGAPGVPPDEDIAPHCLRLMDTLLFSEEQQCVLFAALRILEYLQRSLKIQYNASHNKNKAGVATAAPSPALPRRLSLLRRSTSLSRELSLGTLRVLAPVPLDAVANQWKAALVCHRWQRLFVKATNARFRAQDSRPEVRFQKTMHQLW